MTNAEKARELCKLYQANRASLFQHLLAMAEWKDEQFSKFLLWLDDYYVIRKFDDGEPMTYEELIDAFKNMDT